MVLSPNDEEVASPKKHTQFTYPISDQNDLKTIPFGRRTYTYTAHPYKGVPPSAKNALQIMNLAAYACESNKGQSGPLPLDSKTQVKCLLSVKF